MFQRATKESPGSEATPVTSYFLYLRLVAAVSPSILTGEADWIADSGWFFCIIPGWNHIQIQKEAFGVRKMAPKVCLPFSFSRLK